MLYGDPSCQKESFFEAPLALGLAGRDGYILTAKRLFNEIGRLTEPPRNHAAVAGCLIST